MTSRHENTLTLPFQQMHHQPVSDAAYLPSCCDEELADEADEPPDVTRGAASSDKEFTKHAVRQPLPAQSLLTRAILASPELSPVDPHHGYQRGMSDSSAWSLSTAELTSDGMTTPSRPNTPSPPLPMYLSGITSVMQNPKWIPPANHVAQQADILSNTSDPLEAVPKKRCITFACTSRRPSDEGAGRVSQAAGDTRKPSALTFVCSQADSKPRICHASFATSHPHSANEASRYSTTRSIEIDQFARTEPKPLYESDGLSTSWANAPIDRSRLLKVDDLLLKEQRIRKLTEEAELEEADEDEDGVSVIDQYDEDDEDEDEDEDEEEGEEEDEEGDESQLEDDEDEADLYYDDQSGNETDNEEGFASDDDSDDEEFFGSHPICFYEDVRPCCAQRISAQSSPRHIRSPAPELPDSTDFVCGTLDEDKPLEEAYLSYLSGLEERKRSRHKQTPQDIDPSFPTSDSDESEDEKEIWKPKQAPSRSNSFTEARGRRPVALSRSPHGRLHSPPPPRRTGHGQSPAPKRRTPNQSRRGSPAPPRRGRGVSPAPVGRHHIQFQSNRNVVRTRSLPRTSGWLRRNTKLGKPGVEPATRPVSIRRGAMDIVKGLEKRRERRKARLARGEKGEGWKVGEGMEKMRELALELIGKGKPRQPVQWVISA